MKTYSKVKNTADMLKFYIQPQESYSKEITTKALYNALENRVASSIYQQHLLEALDMLDNLQGYQYSA